MSEHSIRQCGAGLERIDGKRAVLAIQRWPDREHWKRVTTGSAFEAWFDAYRPILDDWDQLVFLEAEWETIELIRAASLILRVAAD